VSDFICLFSCYLKFTGFSPESGKPETYFSRWKPEFHCIQHHDTSDWSIKQFNVHAV